MKYKQGDLVIKGDAKDQCLVLLITQDTSKGVVVHTDNSFPLGTYLDIENMETEIFSGTVKLTCKPPIDQPPISKSFRYVPAKGKINPSWVLPVKNS